ncbi:hypothetical protein [Vulcanisaeta sp. JCM 16161]|uniref:hypothetical protein n=1 Tax=Vulcanisaeta sp. JCM 16161 TaxID=1295372 RepID=UPI00406D0750
MNSFLRSLLGRGDQEVAQSSQPKPVVDSLPMPLPSPQPQPCLTGPMLVKPFSKLRPVRH